MKRLAFILVAAFLSLAAGNNPRNSYIEKYSKLAVSEMKRTGVPASIILAQGILESNSGQSRLAVEGKNHFGIKCHNDWKGKTIKEDDDRKGECFRVYPSVEASFRDHSDFLRGRDRYKFLFDLDPQDYKAWARGLKKAGYATASDYATRLITLIEDYKLYRFDKGTVVQAPSPNEEEAPKPAPVKDEKKLIRDYKESVEVASCQEIFEQNGVPFIYSVDGQTYESIAACYNLFLKELLRYNDLDAIEELQPGTRVYLARKKAQAKFVVGKYVVDHDGETLREISQRFGVRLSSLKRMNVLIADKKLEEGDTVILSK